jgi:hypothetical protein
VAVGSSAWELAAGFGLEAVLGEQAGQRSARASGGKGVRQTGQI